MKYLVNSLGRTPEISRTFLSVSRALNEAESLCKEYPGVSFVVSEEVCTLKGDVLVSREDPQ